MTTKQIVVLHSGTRITNTNEDTIFKLSFLTLNIQQLQINKGSLIQ